MKALTRSLVGLLLCLGLASSDESKPTVVTLVADVWCPYNCEPQSPKPGYLIEIAKEAFKAHGYEVKYTLATSWEKAIEQTRQGQYDGIIGAFPPEAPDFHFPTTELGSAQDSFLVRAESQWNYKGIGSLKNLCLGVIAGYSYGGELDTYIQKHRQDPKRIYEVSGNEALRYLLKRLRYHQVDAIVDDSYVLKYTLDESKQRQLFRLSSFENPDPVYIAFQPGERGKWLAQVLNLEVPKMIKDGRMKIILQHYGIDPWYEGEK